MTEFLFLLQFAVVMAALAVGARVGGVGLGVWGGVGLLVLTFGFGLTPTSPPIDVMLIILSVVTAASAMEAAGGIDFLVGVAERIIRSRPRAVTLVAPLVAWAFTVCCGTGHIVYPLFPVIYEVAYENGIRPERPLAVATIASQQGITASPVSAAMAVLLALFTGPKFGLIQILCIAVPATLAGVTAAACVQTFVGRELADDPEYQRRLKAGLLQPPAPAAATGRALPRGAALSAGIFLTGVALVVLLGARPGLRPSVVERVALHPALAPAVRPAVGAAVGPGVGGVAVPRREPLGMPLVIEMTMLGAGALILLLTGASAAQVVRGEVMRAGVTAVVGIFGMAWMGDTLIAGNKELIVRHLGDMARAYAPLFALGLFLGSALLYSQAATSRALMPLGVALGIPPPVLTALFPAVNGNFVLPNYGTVLAAISFDRSGTTGIGRFVLNHSFMLPGLVATATAVLTGLALANLLY